MNRHQARRMEARRKAQQLILHHPELFKEEGGDWRGQVLLTSMAQYFDDHVMELDPIVELRKLAYDDPTSFEWEIRAETIACQIWKLRLPKGD